MRSLTRFGTALGIALAAGASTAKADYPDMGAYATAAKFYAASTTVTVNFLYSLAGANNNLFMFATIGNAGTLLIAVPGSAPYPGTGTPNSVVLNTNPGDEIIFGICSSTPSGAAGVCGSSNLRAWYMGPASRNTDNELHAAIIPSATWNGFGVGTAATSGTFVIGFEDKTILDSPPSDWDYNDVVFEVVGTTIPEPATMVLLATGLVGLSGAGMVRRRRSQAKS